MNCIEVPFDIISLDIQQNIQPIIEAYIDKQLVRMVVDTGASHSCLSKQLMKRLRLEKNETLSDVVMGIGRGKQTQKLVSVPHFRIGALEFRDYSFLIIQIAHINKALSNMGIESIHGLLGSDILYTYKAIIDYASQKITFQQPIQEDIVHVGLA
jgi:hypothetical protein